MDTQSIMLLLLGYVGFMCFLGFKYKKVIPIKLEEKRERDRRSELRRSHRGRRINSFATINLDKDQRQSEDRREGKLERRFKARRHLIQVFS